MWETVARTRIFIWIVILVCGCSGQSHNPPASNFCPGVLQYVYDNGQYKGLISIQPPVRFSSVSVRINMTTDYSPQNYGIGSISVQGGSNQIQEISDRVTHSEIQVIHFLVSFPLNQPIPKIISVNINGQEFCSGQIPGYRYKGLVNLEYSLSTGVLNAPYVQGNQFIPGVQQGNGGNSIQRPYVPQQTEQPVYQQPVYQQPQQPVYQQSQKPVYQQPQKPVYQQPQQPVYQQPQQPIRIPASESSDKVNVDTGSCKTGPPETLQCLKRCEQLGENQKSPIQRRNSITLLFKQGPLPPAKDIHTWLNDALAIPADDVDAIQYLDEIATVIIKFKKETTGQDIVSNEHGFKTYTHRNGTVEEVELKVIGVGLRKVEIFDLPLELPEERIEKFLQQYGTVHNVTYQYWDESFTYRVKNGDRLVNIFLKRPINKIVDIDGFKGIVQYDEQPVPCNCTGTIKRICGETPASKTSNSLSAT